MDLSSFVMPVRSKKRPPTEVQAVAAEIAAAFGETKRLGLYLHIVKKMGVTWARRTWREIEQDGARNRAAVFIWRATHGK